MSTEAFIKLRAQIAERTAQLMESERQQRATVARRSMVNRPDVPDSQPSSRRTRRPISGEERREHLLLLRTAARTAVCDFLSGISQIEHVKVTVRGAQVRRDSWEVVPFHPSNWPARAAAEAWIAVRHGGVLIVHELITVEALNAEGNGLGVVITSLVGPDCDRPRRFRGQPSLLRYLNGSLSDNIAEAVSHVQAHEAVLREEIDQILARHRQASAAQDRRGRK